MDIGPVVELLAGRRIVALTGAGCSTESGIPDYRGPDTPPRKRPPIQHREFVDRSDARQRYWARSLLGWPRLARARPNAGHAALARLEDAGRITGLITQNVDGLHGAAGSRGVVELHGAIARVRCLACGELTARDDLQTRLLDANPAFRDLVASSVPRRDPIGAFAMDGADIARHDIARSDFARPDFARHDFARHDVPPRGDVAVNRLGEAGARGADAPRTMAGGHANRADSADARADASSTTASTVSTASTAPDGDADLADHLSLDFRIVDCTTCGGTLMPDVVFFGGSVPRPTLDAAWTAFDAGEVLLVVGSSLAVFSGYRFVRRAAERGMPVAILNRGPTRGDPHATTLLDAPAGAALEAIAARLV